VSDYDEKLKDPRWQRKRLKILERDGWACQQCGCRDDLHVHHRVYYGDPWEAPDESLITLCERCHEAEHRRIAPGADPESIVDILDWWVVEEIPLGCKWHIEPLERYLMNPPTNTLVGRYKIIGIFPTSEEANHACDLYEKEYLRQSTRRPNPHAVGMV